jgi:hypothetical protein
MCLLSADLEKKRIRGSENHGEDWGDRGQRSCHQGYQSAAPKQEV